MLETQALTWKGAYTALALVNVQQEGRKRAASTITTKPSPGEKGSPGGTPRATFTHASTGTPGMSSCAPAPLSCKQSM
jgi:hypothetical protein